MNIVYALKFGRNELKALAEEIAHVERSDHYERDFTVEFPRLKELWLMITNINFDPKSKNEAPPADE